MNIHWLFDIDSTLTEYRAHALERLFDGNFLFPLIADLAESHGLNRAEAEQRIREEEINNPFWDYPDFVRTLGLSMKEALPVFRRWHTENITAYQDSVRLVRTLLKWGSPVSVISNNPHLGCLLKLEQCGLADPGNGTSVFRNILSTDLLKGCKGNDGVWKRAVTALRSQDQAELIMIGDNPDEDGRLARLHGVKRSFILNRSGNIKISEDPEIIVVPDADAILPLLKVRNPERVPEIPAEVLER